jgi:hypothetical protein
LCNALICIGLLCLQLRADVIADVHVGNVDRENFKRGVTVETFGENSF